MHIVFYTLWFLLGNALSEVIPPTRGFKIESLEPFYPGGSLKSVQEKFGPGSPYGENMRRFQITHRSYKFPVFVQAEGDSIRAFWVRMPSYFSHDVIHQDLITRYGKQQDYLKKENTAVYSWALKDKNLKLVYAGQCTITCFPLYLAGTDTKHFTKGNNLLRKMGNLGFPTKP